MTCQIVGVPEPLSTAGQMSAHRRSCFFRIALPTAGLVLSTRERAELRDRLIPLGITQMSAGSSTEPGGYEEPGSAGEQFELEDLRTPGEVADRLRELGYEPVFKDWEDMTPGPVATV